MNNIFDQQTAWFGRVPKQIKQLWTRYGGEIIEFNNNNIDDSIDKIQYFITDDPLGEM
jgi:hypothetical protein